jgi:hypothetical protein
MGDSAAISMPVVDGRTLPRAWRVVLRPGELVGNGRKRRLPCFFYEIASWQEARQAKLADGFHLWEFINVDAREHPSQRDFPRYVPCAITTLAAHLTVLRKHVQTYVHVSANGGYRSPAHQRNPHDASPHCWGAAADLYRVGDDWLETEETIRKYADLLRDLLPAVRVKPYADGDDHLHLDLGYLALVPPDAPDETACPETEAEHD